MVLLFLTFIEISPVSIWLDCFAHPLCAGYPGLTPRPPSPDIWTHISSGRLSFTPFSTLMYISAWAFSLLLMLCLAAHRLHPDLILTPPLSPKPYCLAIKLAFCTRNQWTRHRAVFNLLGHFQHRWWSSCQGSHLNWCPLRPSVLPLI